MRIGLVMGEIIVSDGLVCGEVVVLAQRLEQACPPGGIRTDKLVSNVLDDPIQRRAEGLTLLRVKGFDATTEAHLLNNGPSPGSLRRVA